MTDEQVRVPLVDWNTEQRRRLRSLAAGALLDIRWEGDAAVLVSADDAARLRELVAAIGPEQETGARTNAGAVPPSVAAMWALDPTGRHEYRYWSGTTWTAHVADQGIERADPLTDVPSALPIAPPPGAYRASTPAVAGFWRTTDPTAVMGRRYGAFFIDVAISLAAFAIIFFPIATQRTAAETLRLPGCSRESTSGQVQCSQRAVMQIGDTVYEADIGATAALDVLFTFLYFGILEGVMGATLGKRATGLRVVKEDGTLQGVPKSLLRWLVFAVDGPLSLFLCGIITSATSQGHRRLGDMSAHTYVVAKESVGEPITIHKA